jgi:hypothetical protein
MFSCDRRSKNQTTLASAKLLYLWEANPDTFAEVLPPHFPPVDCHFEEVWE